MFFHSIIRRRCERSDQRASRVISTHSQVAGLACLTRHVAPIRVILSFNRRKQFDLFQKKSEDAYGILAFCGTPLASRSLIPPTLRLSRYQNHQFHLASPYVGGARAIFRDQLVNVIW